MTAPYFATAGQGNAVATGNGTPIAPDISLAGDIWVCLITQRDNVVATMDAAWAPLYAANSNATGRAAAFWHRYDGVSTPVLTVTRAGGDAMYSRIVVLRGCLAAGSPFDTSTTLYSGISSATVNFNSVTPTFDESLVCAVVHAMDNGTAGGINGTGPTFLEIFEAFTAQGLDCGLVFCTGAMDSGYPTGARALTYSLPEHHIGAMFVVKNTVAIAPPAEAFDPNRVVLCWPNRVDQATLSLGSWEASLPLSHLQTRPLSQKARSTNALVTSTKFKINLDSGRQMYAVALAAHNFSASAEWRVRFYSDYDQTQLLWDSTQVSVWPDFFQFEQLEWEDDNFWLGNDSLDATADYTTLATMFADQRYNDCRSLLVEVFDTGNSSGYVEIGRCFVSTGWQPTFGMDYGAQFGHNVNTPVEETLDNTEYFDRRRARRTAQFQLTDLTPSEAFNTLYAMQRDLGIDKELLLAYATAPSEQFYFRTFLGRLKQIDPLQSPYFERWQVPFMVQEIV